MQASNDAAPPRDFLNYVPSSAPGGRAPHAWLHDGSSLFDHFGPGLTLLALPAASADCLQAAERDADAMGIPFRLLQSDNPSLQALYTRRLTLIRPDQHIAWAGDVWPDRADFDVLAMATGRQPVSDVETLYSSTHHKETSHVPGS